MARRKKKVREGKRPWSHRTDDHSSAVFDADGKIICGSMLMKADPDDFKNHALIVEAVNVYPKCPVDSGIFGKDLDRFRQCTVCEIWEDCADLHDRLEKESQTAREEE